MRKLFLVLLSLVLPTVLYAQEICNNGVDDDADGLVDLNDSDCGCSGIGLITGITSLIPNPSFEDTLCCPTWYSQLDECSDSWVQASDATSDLFNTCGFTSVTGGLPPFPFPLPGGGDGYAGFYNFPGYQEMIGACLLSPMKADSTYRLSFFLAKGSATSPSFVVSIYGTPDCNDLPWTGFGCPIGTGSWVLLGEDSVVFADNSWHHVLIDLIPSQDIRALAIGGSCSGTPVGFEYYYYIDELIVAAASQFDDKISIEESGKWCTRDLRLQAAIDTSGGAWQWYRAGIALSGETNTVLDLMPYGTDVEYTAVYTLGDDCVSIVHSVDTTDPANRPRELVILNNDTTVCEGSVVPVNAVATPGYQYQWFPTTGVSDPASLTPDITAGADTGVFYTVTASYPDCPDTTVGFRISMQAIPSVDLGNDTIVCRGDLVPLMALIEPYRADYAYEWSPAAGLHFSQAANNYFRADSNVTYRLAVSTPIGCSGADSIRIEVQPDSFAAVIADTGYCPPNALTLWAEGGSSYRWEPAYGLDDVNTATPLASPETPTTYSVYVRNDYGCGDTAQVFIDVYPLAVLNMPDTIRIYPGEQYHLEPGTNCHYFNWFPTNGINSITAADPVFYPEVRTRYFVSARTDQGCALEDSVDVLVEETAIDMPNAFVPGKGTVPVLKPAKRGIAELVEFSVYNRWGNRVFHTTNIEEGWDGTYKGVPQLMGVYVYHLEAITDNGQRFRKDGNVTLMR